MYITIGKDDLNKVKNEIDENNYKKTDRIENFKKVIWRYSLVIAFITLLLFSIYIMVNDTSMSSPRW